jgi:hypothetical protein
MKRLLTLLIVAGVIAWLVKTYGTSHVAAPDARGSPVDRARSAAAASDSRTAATNAVGQEADAAAGGSVSENMTPDQVRALLGTPDDVSTEAMSSGGTRETWSYRRVGKTVVFENGVAVSVR